LGLDDIIAAHRYMENNQATGKVVIVPQPPGERESELAPFALNR
jgi:hypothetical protein